MNKHILVVEDDPGFQELITAILSKRFQLTICSSVEDALAQADAGGFHLIISDLNLLGMSGFELLARMRESGRIDDCPFVFCSGQVDEDTKQKALNMGAAGFIAKPYQPEAVLALVCGLLI